MVLYHESRKLRTSHGSERDQLVEKKKKALIYVARWILSVTDFMQYG